MTSSKERQDGNVCVKQNPGGFMRTLKPTHRLLKSTFGLGTHTHTQNVGLIAERIILAVAHLLAPIQPPSSH